MKRATGDFVNNVIRLFISIHALVKRATQVEYKLSTVLLISIHALVKRATGVKKTFQNLNYISIHALVKRATPQGVIFRFPKSEFQSTPS